MSRNSEVRKEKPMRSVKFAIASLIALMSAASPIAVSGQTALYDGQVTKIDETAGKITIKHSGPIPKFEMDEPMTMVYRVQDPAMLKAVKAGDKVKFDADRVNNQFTVTKIQTAK
jgi:Cu/Ag efflux protein CusF